MSRRLLRLTLAAIIGYGFCWADRAYGTAPIFLLLLVAAVSWLAGAVYTALPLTLAVAEAHRERDTACALAVSVQEGATFEPVPSYIDKREAERLNRRLRSIPCQHDPACGDVR